MTKIATQADTVKSAHATVAPRLVDDELELDSGEGVGDGVRLGAGVLDGDGVTVGDGVPGLGVVDAAEGAGVVCADTGLRRRHVTHGHTGITTRHETVSIFRETSARRAAVACRCPGGGRRWCLLCVPR